MCTKAALQLFDTTVKFVLFPTVQWIFAVLKLSPDLLSSLLLTFPNLPTMKYHVLVKKVHMIREYNTLFRANKQALYLSVLSFSWNQIHSLISAQEQANLSQVLVCEGLQLLY